MAVRHLRVRYIYQQTNFFLTVFDVREMRYGWAAIEKHRCGASADKGHFKQIYFHHQCSSYHKPKATSTYGKAVGRNLMLGGTTEKYMMT